ncbi:sodium-dependent nutrient amino acid transporter 1-like [Littorina saxatilis]|uniref:sodium-dependent nutrient amino acid transporter 1-like n=1 Tax=Littorina saxatilis TaxID=31220 RepID=UPI0038B5EB7C
MTAGLGSNYMFGSYKRFDEKVHLDILIVAAMDYLTNMLAALSVFLVLGYHAKKSNLRINNLIKKDEGLVFIAYPSALATLPQPGIWSSIFFLLLYMLAIDTEFGNIETVVTYLQDDFRWVRRNNVLARYITGIVGLLLSICLVTPIGLQIIQIMDYSVMANLVPFIVFGELVAVFWVYGFNNFVDDMESMLNLKVRCRDVWFIYCVVILPIFVGLLPFMRNVKEKSEIEPDDWNWILSHSIFYIHIAPVIIWFPMDIKAVITRYWRYGRKTMFKKLFRPNNRWGPNDGSNVSRDVDSVFADVIPSMRRRKPRRECPSSSDFPFAYVHRSFLRLPDFVTDEGREIATGKAGEGIFSGVLDLEVISLGEEGPVVEKKPEEEHEAEVTTSTPVVVEKKPEEEHEAEVTTSTPVD